MAPGSSRRRTGLLRLGPALMAAVLLASACSANDSADSTPATGPTSPIGDTSGTGPVRIGNQGGTMEGHTPRGFPGMGTGLFTGDNLNSRFPEGDGVQLFLTFPLPPGLARPSRARLTTDAMRISGTPFADLGGIRAGSVDYDSFGPQVFDIPTDGEPVACERIGETGLSCDVTELVGADIGSGATVSQFRLRFDQAADGDGRQDLAMFFLTDSNTNEPGIFVLELTP